MATSEDNFYEIVALEIQNKVLKAGLWTKSYADADGDPNRARAIYIKHRVRELRNEERARLRQLEIHKRHQAAQNEIKRNRDKKRSDENHEREFEGRGEAYEL